MVDVDQNELTKPTLKLDLPINMDAGSFIKECLACLPKSLPSFSHWIDRCKDWRRQFPPDSYTGPSLPPDSQDKRQIYPLSVLRALSDALTEGDIVIADGGPALIYTLLGFRFKSNQRLVSSTGLELPGFALAGAIGACVANNREPVICLCEDRGFRIGIQDLQTIIDYELPIKILVFASKGHSIIRNIQRDYFGSRFIGTDHEVRLGSAPLIEIAKAFGFPTFETSHVAHLESKISEWVQTDGPAVIEIQVEDDQYKIPRPAFTFHKDQKWRPKPLEDMSPFLDRKTLAESMLIDLVHEN